MAGFSPMDIHGADLILAMDRLDDLDHGEPRLRIDGKTPQRLETARARRDRSPSHNRATPSGSARLEAPLHLFWPRSGCKAGAAGRPTWPSSGASEIKQRAWSVPCVVLRERPSPKDHRPLRLRIGAGRARGCARPRCRRRAPSLPACNAQDAPRSFSKPSVWAWTYCRS